MAQSTSDTHCARRTFATATGSGPIIPRPAAPAAVPAAAGPRAAAACFWFHSRSTSGRMCWGSAGFEPSHSLARHTWFAAASAPVLSHSALGPASAPPSPGRKSLK
ncbi:hypothetical protein TSOC_002766 [Tetrabaena socialis]|uniref:Uncharacterized protein n=1 Tax=Tetrabaena socialis TaxID=47790 RepID=A0A2J8AD90_9CHLO|nr:hypothetical protein TSOC_002766 [Tetrabaena socialis]|eukprot:PNH10488.1 hypothetical protein TSOC_002766 [Tetrabaena socialis]